MFRAAVIACVFALAAFSQPPLTSDSSKARVLPHTNFGIYPGRAALYVPPVIDVGVVFQTNMVPLLVEETITSNVVQSVRWYDNGILRTNTTTLSSNVVSRTTNTVVK